MKTGFYELAERYGDDIEYLLDDDECLWEVFEYPDNLMVEPIAYLHGACDMFAWFLAGRYGYGIRSYHARRQGYQDLLVHAVCFCDLADGTRAWIDIRGITDDEDEMLAPFADDIADFESQGYSVVWQDYPADAGWLKEFVLERTDPARDLAAFAGELSELLEESMLGVYAM